MQPNLVCFVAMPLWLVLNMERQHAKAWVNVHVSKCMCTLSACMLMLISLHTLLPGLSLMLPAHPSLLRSAHGPSSCLPTSPTLIYPCAHTHTWVSWRYERPSPGARSRVTAFTTMPRCLASKSPKVTSQMSSMKSG